MPLSAELLIAVAIPVLALSVLRVNAAMVFLSVCLGDVLVTHVAQGSDSLITFLAPHTGSVSSATLQLAILLAPAALTSVIMIFSVHGRLRVLVNILPAAGASLLIALLAVPLLTPGLRGSIEGNTLWQQLNRAEAFIVGVSAFISLVFLWSQRRHARKFEHDKRHRF